MLHLRYVNEWGDFHLDQAGDAPEMVFPLANESGMISSVTPRLSGDCKTGQNTFLLAPASAETLHESRASRNFFLRFQGPRLWSAAGVSAPQQAALFNNNKEETWVDAGLLWYEAGRRNRQMGVEARILSFVPAEGPTVELMRVTVKNIGEAPLSFLPTAAIPLYGRSADNIRDHRHVTSLLHRLTVTEDGVALRPTMTFDERGHKQGHTVYSVRGKTDGGQAPVRFLGPVQDYVGAGSYDWPQALLTDGAAWMRPGDRAEGYEMAAVLQFEETTLSPGAETSYFLALGVDCGGEENLSPAAFADALEQTKSHWRQVGAAAFQTGNAEMDGWLRWVAVQPELRRICGCSFLPHHDYGRGGRGWRDLWQDSLALILRSPARVREDLSRYFAGVRADGTNATIIGARPGEFLADRNNIVRVWMDHGYWPLVTVNEYIAQSGDLSILADLQPWFWDNRKHRGETLSGAMPPASQLQYRGETAKSTVLEHLIVQNVTAFFDPGDHGCIRLRGADWNDALDMAANRGESVAFTAAYAGNLDTLARLCHQLVQAGKTEIPVSAPLRRLIYTDPALYASPAARRDARCAFETVCEEEIGKTQPLNLTEAADILSRMGQFLRDLLARQEMITDGQCRWMNSYYDNDGQRVEGLHGDRVRMMLTGQVFALMGGATEEKDALDIIRAADRFLFDESRGGYCLNTDFGQDIPPLGRQFGFAWGHKENGAVFCHMAVMYAFALIRRGFSAEGWKALNALICQSMNVPVSRLYPGIPEYFDPRGRGMYPYLTGAGSWLMLTLITQLFGVQGDMGDLRLTPHLLPAHFDGRGRTAIRCFFAEKEITVIFHRPDKEVWDRLTVSRATLDGKAYEGGLIPRQALASARHAVINVELEGI